MEDDVVFWGTQDILSWLNDLVRSMNIDDYGKVNRATNELARRYDRLARRVKEQEEKEWLESHVSKPTPEYKHKWTITVKIDEDTE